MASCLLLAVSALALAWSVDVEPLDGQSDAPGRVLLENTPGVPKQVEAQAIAQGAKLMAKLERPYIVKHDEAIAQANAKKEVEELGERRKAALLKLHKEEQNEAQQAEMQRENASMQAFQGKLVLQKKRSHTAEKALKVELQQINKKKSAKAVAQHSALHKDQDNLAQHSVAQKAVLSGEMTQIRKAGTKLVKTESARVRVNLEKAQEKAMKKANAKKMEKSAAELSLKQEWKRIEAKQAVHAQQIAAAHAVLSMDLAQPAH